jgi:hypothetical protein
MKELKVYLLTIVVVALIWHKDQWLDHPTEHIMNLPYGGAFGVPALIHPLVFGFFAYMLVWIVKLPFRKKDKDI